MSRSKIIAQYWTISYHKESLSSAYYYYSLMNAHVLSTVNCIIFVYINMDQKAPGGLNVNAERKLEFKARKIL